MNKFWQWMEVKGYGEKRSNVYIIKNHLSINEHVIPATNQMLIGYMLEYIREHEWLNSISPKKSYVKEIIATVIGTLLIAAVIGIFNLSFTLGEMKSNQTGISKELTEFKQNTKDSFNDLKNDIKALSDKIDKIRK